MSYERHPYIQAPLEEPSPHESELVECEGCNLDVYPEDCMNFGSDIFPVWVCSDKSCLKQYIEKLRGKLGKR